MDLIRQLGSFQRHLSVMRLEAYMAGCTSNRQLNQYFQNELIMVICVKSCERLQAKASKWYKYKNIHNF